MAELDDPARQVVAELFETCRRLHRDSYPQSQLDFDLLDLTGKLTHGAWAHARGNFADVYRGNMHMGNGLAVAVKMLRLPAYTVHDDKIYRTALLRFFREINIWSALDHPNVAPCLGYTLTGGSISLISPWHDKGNLVQFLRMTPGASEQDLILDVAEGTQYLHTQCSNPLIHGDLKGANILVSEHGIARLADFGISKQIDDMNRNTGFTTTSGVSGTLPWMAPELAKGSPLTFACDIYSAAGVFLEICCPGKTPYHYLRQTRDLIRAKNAGNPPDLAQYSEMSEKMALWGLMCTCWAYNPLDRPEIASIVKSLYGFFKLRPRVDQTVTLRPSADLRITQKVTRPRADSVEFGPGLNAEIEGRLKRQRRQTLLSTPDQVTAQGYAPPTPHPVPPSLYMESDSNFSFDMDGDVTMSKLIAMNFQEVPAEHLKYGSDWYAIFNPQVDRAVDVDLITALAHESPVACVKFSPDGKYLATGCDRTAQVYDTKTWEKTHTLFHFNANYKDGLNVACVGFSSDSKLLATGAEDKRLRIWAIDEGKVRTTFDGHIQKVCSLAFSPDGSRVVSGSSDMTCRIWDLRTGEAIILTAGIGTHTFDTGFTSVTFSPDGQRVAAGSVDSTVRIWDAMTGELVEHLKGHKDAVYSVSFTPSGEIISGSWDKTIKCWSLGRDPYRPENPRQGISPFNQGLVGREELGSRGTCLASLSGHQDHILSVATSHCGSWVVSGSKDRGVYFWDASNPQTPLVILKGHKNPVFSVDLSPTFAPSTSGFVATGGGDSSAHIWSYRSM